MNVAHDLSDHVLNQNQIIIALTIIRIFEIPEIFSDFKLTLTIKKANSWTNPLAMFFTRTSQNFPRNSLIMQSGQNTVSYHIP